MNKTLETPPAGLPVLDLAAIRAATNNSTAEHTNPATLPLPLDELSAASGEGQPPAGLPVVGSVDQIARVEQAQYAMDTTGMPPGHRDRLAALGEVIDKHTAPSATHRALGALATRFR
ncbi:hypothetical protein JNM87_02750 [Candidatus Saccharibacteria bacterium]|nr:hypothetical protein [Candidatus Saccharibacteria bacterium]